MYIVYLARYRCNSWCKLRHNLHDTIVIHVQPPGRVYEIDQLHTRLRATGATAAKAVHTDSTSDPAGEA